MTRKIRVGVIFGGRSGEHEVSLASARSVMDAIDKEKYEVVPIGITKEGRWIASGDPMKALASGEADASRPAARILSRCSSFLIVTLIRFCNFIQKGVEPRFSRLSEYLGSTPVNRCWVRSAMV